VILLIIYLLIGFLYSPQELKLSDHTPGLVGDLPVRIQTVNRFLPFILLRFKTLRPLLVLILSKKP